MDGIVEVPGVVVLAPLAVISVVGIGATVARRRGRWTWPQLAVWIVTAGYALGVVAVAFLPVEVHLGQQRSLNPWYNNISPIPILTIEPVNFVLNIIMMVPLGFLLPLLRPSVTSLRAVAARAALASLGIELTQLGMYIVLDHGRTTDINDVVANTLGGIFGLLLLRLVIKPDMSRNKVMRSSDHPLPIPGGRD